MLYSILTALVFSSTEPENPKEDPDEKKTLWNWRRLLEILKDVGSVGSVVLSLLKFLQDLGLL